MPAVLLPRILMLVIILTLKRYSFLINLFIGCGQKEDYIEARRRWWVYASKE
jgi:hypothetical protein